jgi:hypothetical protein
MNEKIVIYQILTRLYGNRNTTRKENGTIEENGCGKMNDLTPAVLKRIRGLGMTHVWFTGIIRHATQTDYSAFGIPRQHPAVVKGRTILMWIPTLQSTWSSVWRSSSSW